MGFHSEVRFENRLRLQSRPLTIDELFFICFSNLSPPISPDQRTRKRKEMCSTVAHVFQRKLKEEDRKSVNNWCLSVFPFISICFPASHWCLSVFPFISICSYWFLSVSFSFSLQAYF